MGWPRAIQDEGCQLRGPFSGAHGLENKVIQVELKPEIEAQLVAEAHAEGVEPSVYAGNVLERVYLRGGGAHKPSRSPEEVRAWLDSMAQFSDKIPQLPEDAFTRESFYRDPE